MKISVVYALSDAATLLELDLPEGATVAAALDQCRNNETLRELPLLEMTTGIFGRVVSVDTELREGDRVELYRPLQADPKEARRKRGRKPRR